MITFFSGGEVDTLWFHNISNINRNERFWASRIFRKLLNSADIAIHNVPNVRACVRTCACGAQNTAWRVRKFRADRRLQLHSRRAGQRIVWRRGWKPLIRVFRAFDRHSARHMADCLAQDVESCSAAKVTFFPSGRHLRNSTSNSMRFRCAFFLLFFYQCDGRIDGSPSVCYKLRRYYFMPGKTLKVDLNVVKLHKNSRCG